MPVRSTMGKYARRRGKRVTIDDVWATIEEIGKVHKELEQAQKRTEMALERTEKAIEESQKAIEESQKAMKESQKRTDKAIEESQKAMEESQKRTDKAIEESQKAIEESQKRTDKAIEETQKQVDKTNKAISGLGSTVGSLVEHVMTPDLPGKFREFGFSFNRVTTIKCAVEGNIYAQIDGLLENGEQAMVVEVKTTLHNDDIDDHLERLDKMRAYSDAHGDKRQFLGAIAAMITDESARKYALKKGFFVIEPSGENVKVTKPLSEPRIW